LKEGRCVAFHPELLVCMYAENQTKMAMSSAFEVEVVNVFEGIL
jgi:hypothetical protein